jgi:hypothetical protein
LYNIRPGHQTLGLADADNKFYSLYFEVSNSKAKTQKKFRFKFGARNRVFLGVE